MMKRIIAYLLYVLGLLLLVFYAGQYQEEFRVLAGRTFNPLPSILFSSIYPFIVGLYISLPQFINMLRKTGTLKVNWVRILIVGIPALVINSNFILYYLTPLGSNPLFGWIYHGYSLVGVSLIGAACGFTILSSITKEEVRDQYSSNKGIDFSKF